LKNHKDNNFSFIKDLASSFKHVTIDYYRR